MKTDNRERNHLSKLSLLTSLPFHHLLSAEKIYSAVTARYSDLNIPSLLQTPNERLRLFREAIAGQNDSTAIPVILNRYIQLGLSENISFDDNSSQNYSTGFDSNESKKSKSENKLQSESEIDWQVIFRDELQGSAEIYRAEMLIFKRLIYEQKEKLQSPFELTNEKFSRYLNYELFNVLTDDLTELLLLNSLSANYTLSVSTPSDNVKKDNILVGKLPIDKRFEKAAPEAEQNATVLADRIREWKSYYVEDENTNQNFLSNEKQHKLTIYSLKLGGYWHRWREAAQLAKFDFDLLETINDSRAIRFYELTKLVRLFSYDKKTQTLPDQLEIDYEKFTSLMPLPKFRTEEEIEHQIVNFIKPLKAANYTKSFSNDRNLDDKTKYILSFKFNQ